MPLQLSVEHSFAPSGEQVVRFGRELLDDYLTFLAGRARPNSVLAAAFDLKVFFSFAQQEPSQITSRDVLNFIAAQRAPRTHTQSCASPTVDRACRPGPLLGDCRRSRGCSPIWSSAATPR